MPKTYTAGVVGAGSGGLLSLAALDASPRFDLVAAADINPAAREALQARFPNIRVFASHEAMFADSPTDVVCISTYPPTHTPIALAALDLPLKGLLVEKPLADTHAAASEILRAARSRSLPLAVPHGLLVAAHSTEIIRRLRAGDIGALTLVEIQCDQWDIMSAGIHWLNFFLWLVAHEPVAWVLAACDTSTRTYRDGMQVETIAVTYAQTNSGVRVAMTTGDHVAVRPEGKGLAYRIIGAEGIIEFWGWESAYHIVSPAAPRGETVTVPPHPLSSHQLHLDALAAQIDAGRPDYTIADSSLAALELCEAAYLSARRRCQVTLPLADFSPPPPTDWQPGKPYSGRGGGRDGRKLQ